MAEFTLVALAIVFAVVFTGVVQLLLAFHEHWYCKRHPFGVRRDGWTSSVPEGVVETVGPFGSALAMPHVVMLREAPGYRWWSARFKRRYDRGMRERDVARDVWLERFEADSGVEFVSRSRYAAVDAIRSLAHGSVPSRSLQVRVGGVEGEYLLGVAEGLLVLHRVEATPAAAEARVAV